MKWRKIGRVLRDIGSYIFLHFTFADYVIITLFFIRDLFILAQDLKRYVYVDVKWYVDKSRSFLVGISRS